MVTVTVGNSHSSIEGLSGEGFRAIKTLLSYTTGNVFQSKYPQRPKYLIDNKGNFPTGLLKRVIAFLDQNKLKYVVRGQKPTKMAARCLYGDLKGFKPYTAQLAAVDAAMKSGRGTISMPTGTGKSMVIAMIAARLGVRTLVIVPSLEIKKQLAESLSSVFADMTNLTVENIDSKALKAAKDYDCLIIDEAHHVSAKTYQNLNKHTWAGIRYRFFLTATPFRNQTEETLLFEGIAGQVIYNLSYKEAIDKGYIVPVEAYYIEMPKIKTDAFMWAEVYSELVVNYEARNLQIAVLLARLNAAQTPTLCLVKEVKHGKILSALTGIPFVHGQDEESRDYIRQFNSGGIKALIGTEGVIGEGIDTKPCEYVIIAGLGKAKSAFQQKVGRAVRRYGDKESAKVILIKDRSHKFCLRHFAEQVKIMKEEYGVVPSKLEL